MHPSRLGGVRPAGRLPRHVALAGACFLGGAAWADRVHLDGGGALDGHVEIVDGRVQLQVERAAFTYPMSMVKEIEWGRSPDEEYAERAAALKADDAGGHADLARWCREKHLDQAYVKELLIVARAAPEHPLAQDLARHGYVYLDGAWMSVEFCMMRQGRRLYKGEWLLPEEEERRRAAEKSRQEAEKASAAPSAPPPSARPPAPAQAKPSARSRREPRREPVRRRRYALLIGIGGGLIDER